MGKIAFVFSGQGDQFPGMGMELARQYASAREVFAVCDRIRPGTSEQCFHGTDEELKETKNTQPCLFAMELAAVAVLKEHGICPDAVAGFSLGEVAACTAAGLVDLETGFRLVCRRGELMQAAAEMQETGMAAVVKLTPAQVEEVCSRFDQVYPVNYNCPGQVSVAGRSDQMTAFGAAVKAAGGRALPLKVKGAFHSPFMKEASESFAEELKTVDFAPGEVPLYSNVTARPYEEGLFCGSSNGSAGGSANGQTDGSADGPADGSVVDASASSGRSFSEKAASLLSRQICSPVRWEDTIRHMIASGIDIFIEIGPGKTLTNMIGKIDPGVKRCSVADLPEILAEVRN